MILITGSGAQDRDESLLGHKPFLVLADYLSRRGVAVLRVDDRGVGGSTGSIKTSTSEDFAGDVLAGLDFLKGRKEIDARKLGLIGHSEGGIIAPMAAARSKDVAFIVLMAGTGLPGAQILEAQGQLILKASGSSESEMKIERDAQKRLIDIIAQEKDEKIAHVEARRGLEGNSRRHVPNRQGKALADNPGGLSEAAVNAFNNAWFRFFLTYDPRPTLRTVQCPGPGDQRRKRLASPREGKPRGDRQGPQGGRQPERQDGRAAGPQSPLPALQDRHPERIRHDRDDDCSGSVENHGRLDLGTDWGEIGLKFGSHFVQRKSPPKGVVAITRPSPNQRVVAQTCDENRYTERELSFQKFRVGHSDCEGHHGTDKG